MGLGYSCHVWAGVPAYGAKIMPWKSGRNGHFGVSDHAEKKYSFFALLASYFSLFSQSEDYLYDRSISPLGDHSFLCLSIRKKAKNKTPQLPLVSCATRLAGRPSKLALTSHTERGLLRSSDSRWPKTPANPALLGAADGDPEHLMSAIV